jgi:hypothetical protein
LTKREYYAKYYEKNKYRICNRTLNVYCVKAIEKTRIACPNSVDDYLKRYPFETYAEPNIKKELHKRHIFSSQGAHADCYDAGMFAYLYSVHRCAVMRYDYTEAYIKKMIRIYIVCALVVYSEAQNLCRANGLREMRLNAEHSPRF